MRLLGGRSTDVLPRPGRATAADGLALNVVIVDSLSAFIDDRINQCPNLSASHTASFVSAAPVDSQTMLQRAPQTCDCRKNVETERLLKTSMRQSMP